MKRMLDLLWFVGGVAGVVAAIILVNELVDREVQRPPRRRAPEPTPLVPCTQCGVPEPQHALVQGRCGKCRTRPIRRCAHCETPLPWNHPPTWEGCMVCTSERVTSAWHRQRAARWAARSDLDTPGQLDTEQEAQLVQLLSAVDRAWEAL